MYERHPTLKSRVQDLTDNQRFTEDGMTIETIFTPGHTDDHVSFSVDFGEDEENVLICGDIILGVPSCAIDDFPTYITSL